LFSTYNKNKNHLFWTGLLYASLHVQTCGILTVLTSESANVSDFSQHIILQLVDIESVTSQLL